MAHKWTKEQRAKLSASMKATINAKRLERLEKTKEEIRSTKREQRIDKVFNGTIEQRVRDIVASLRNDVITECINALENL